MLLRPLPSEFRVGTSSWSSQDWVGVFYPEGTPPADFITEYAKHFGTVEIDSTFYRPPTPAMVRNWARRTPQGFKFAAKVPRSITHDKVMQNCEDELKEFLKAMDLLEDKLGPLLFQFPYFNRQAFATLQDFLARLKPLFAKLPSGYSFALETRNKNWINLPLLDLLRQHHIALTLIDHPWMTPVSQLAVKYDLVTADWTYLRWLGDRKGIEQKTRDWSRVIVDRQHEMEAWVPFIDRLLERNVRIYAYFNNHYAGFAPGSVQLLQDVWQRTHLE